MLMMSVLLKLPCTSFVPLRENNGPLKVLLSQSQSAIAPEVMLAI
jgi:hypothetical protein